VTAHTEVQYNAARACNHILIYSQSVVIVDITQEVPTVHRYLYLYCVVMIYHECFVDVITWRKPWYARQGRIACAFLCYMYLVHAPWSLHWREGEMKWKFHWGAGRPTLELQLQYK
jgi:hypothetical protein